MNTIEDLTRELESKEALFKELQTKLNCLNIEILDIRCKIFKLKDNPLQPD